MTIARGRKWMDKKIVLLSYPNLRWLKNDLTTTWNLNPATLCLLGATIKDEFEVQILDAQFYDLSKEEFKRKIYEIMPDYVGISLMTSEYHDVLEMTTELIKAADKHIKIIVGGVHITTQPQLVMQNRDIDYGIIGEGEHVFKKLLSHLEGRNELPAEGITYWQDDKLIVQSRVVVQDLAALPWPDYDLVNFDEYVVKANREHGANRPPDYPYVRIVTSRGCPMGCSFCQVETISGKRVRARDPEDVVNELLFLKEKYNVKAVIFDDDNLLMAKENYAKRLFTLMIENDLNLKWIGTAFAIYLINDEILELMRDSHCVGINIAVESGNERVLKTIVKKPIKRLDVVPDIIRKIKSYGIWCVANFMIGFPGETWEEIRDTIRFAENCNADYVKFFPVIPMHGTKLFELAKEMDALEPSENLSFYDWRYSRVRSAEWRSRDISILRVYEWDRINFAPDRIRRVAEIWDVSIEKLNEIRKKTRDLLI